METIEADYEAYDEDSDESGEAYAAIEEKHERIQGELDALGESLEEFLPMTLRLPAP
jgi:ParB family chromosome partitioning protein